MPLERLACELKSKIESTWLKKKLTRKVKRKLHLQKAKAKKSLRRLVWITKNLLAFPSLLQIRVRVPVFPFYFTH